MKKSQDEKLSSLRFISNKFQVINIIKYFFYFFDLLCLFFIKKSKKSYDKKQVLIVANLGLGDAMNFLSVTDKYSKLYNKKEYKITLMVSKGLDKLFKEETNFDNIYGLNFNECVFNIAKRIKLFKFLNKDNYDILIDGMGTTGAAINMYVCNIVNAKEKITIVNDAISICPEYFLRNIYTKVYHFNRIDISNIEYYNYFLSLLSKKDNYEILFHKTKQYKINIDLPQEYYIVFPSASANVKKWGLEKYAEIISKIYKKTKLTVVFCGTEMDSKSVNDLIKLIDVPYLNIINKTSILEFIQVIKNAKCIITNDTSSYHIAINEEVPVAIITGGYTYDGYVLYNFKNNNYKKPYIIVNKSNCFNCWFNCPYIRDNNIWPCLEAITVDYAWNIIERMIDECDNHE